MAKKTNLRQWTWREYALQLSVVIIGIMVTFVGSDLLTRRSQQRQLRIMMQLIVDELRTNLADFDAVHERIEADRQGMLLFARYGYDVDAIPVDSLRPMGFWLGRTRNSLLQNDALEVLKSSGMSTYVEDKRLMMDIIQCYSYLMAFEKNVGSYNRRKMEAADHMIAHRPSQLILRGSHLGLHAMWKEILADPVCAGFISSAAFYFGSGYFVQGRQNVENVIASINQKYRLE